MGDELVQLRAVLDQTDSQRKSAEQDAEQKQIEILALIQVVKIVNLFSNVVNC